MIGHQELTNWMGQEVLTLSDLFPPDMRAVVVGLNPAPISVEAGHYYQGVSGSRQLARLAEIGLFESAGDGAYLDDAAAASGVGFTDIVKRPTSGEHGVTAREMQQGSRMLNARLSTIGVGLVICVFRHPVIGLLGELGRPGFQVRRTEWGARVFRLPGPFSKRDEASTVMTELKRAL